MEDMLTNGQGGKCRGNEGNWKTGSNCRLTATSHIIVNLDDRTMGCRLEGVGRFPISITNSNNPILSQRRLNETKRT
ncbi:unnamed protein product [Schistosoma mattheei]|uniref:Uncharacterized protein n=1 Tax=Schistosoma mattheei TaxID=31246 RepID=A0A3P8FAF8_9TREM|nr:unnamed protein product [Schistosoma mattheei]